MTNTTSNTTLQTAVQTYINRKNRIEHPEGSFDKQGRWYPNCKQDCCAKIRTPSKAYPYSFMVHCRTIEHIANEFGISPKDLRKEVRTIDAPKREGGDNYYKAVAVVDGKMVSIFDGETEYNIGETIKEQPKQQHGGGTYVYQSQAEAEKVEVPTGSKAKHYPRLILRVRAEGSYCRYDNKLSFSQVTPLEIVGEYNPFSKIVWRRQILKFHVEKRRDGQPFDFAEIKQQLAQMGYEVENMEASRLDEAEFEYDQDAFADGLRHGYESGANFSDWFYTVCGKVIRIYLNEDSFPAIQK